MFNNLKRSYMVITNERVEKAMKRDGIVSKVFYDPFREIKFVKKDGVNLIIVERENGRKNGKIEFLDKDEYVWYKAYQKLKEQEREKKSLKKQNKTWGCIGIIVDPIRNQTISNII
jgi:hypothetical protein